MRKVVVLLLAMCFVLSMMAFAASKGNAVTGWVADEKCGAKGANAKAEECTKKCLAAGEKMVFVTDKDHQVLNIDNPDALKGHEGHHVRVNGKVENGTVHVDSVKMVASSKS